MLKKLTSLLPQRKVKKNVFNSISSLVLADPNFDIPNKIDLLLGADVYGQILLEGLVKGPPGLLIAQNTQLGWILSGQISTSDDPIHCHHVIHSNSDQADDNALLRQFWEIESVIPNQKILSDEEQRCKNIFAQTTHRDKEGRYVVNLPFRDQDPQCQYGSSRDKRRFHLLENKFKRNSEVKARYSEVSSLKSTSTLVTWSLYLVMNLTIVQLFIYRNTPWYVKTRQQPRFE